MQTERNNLIKLQFGASREGTTRFKGLKSFIWNLDGFRLLWVVLFVSIFWIYYNSIRLVTVAICYWNERKPNPAIFFAAFHEKIRKLFRCQREETFQVVMSGVDRAMRGGNGDTTVLLMLATEEAICTAKTLATLLVHCTLLGYQLPADRKRVKTVLLDGAKYSDDRTDWEFFMLIRRNLRRHGVVAVLDAQKLHPRVLRRLVTICSPSFNSSGVSAVLILVMNIKRMYTHYILTATSANKLGRMFLEELLSSYDREELIGILTARCVLVLPEQNLPRL